MPPEWCKQRKDWAGSRLLAASSPLTRRGFLSFPVSMLLLKSFPSFTPLTCSLRLSIPILSWHNYQATTMCVHFIQLSFTDIWNSHALRGKRQGSLYTEGVIFLVLSFEEKAHSQAKRCDFCPHTLRKRRSIAIVTTTIAALDLCNQRTVL